ncbi:G-protein coupled receptor activity protein [Homalodisca vitripennis]|nr:G-protein coupled receptor activity protein [Homalodisca vitripennis]
MVDECYRSLRNNRTRIHKNLFVAMVIQVLIRLTLYIDQALIRSGSEHRANTIRHGIDNTCIGMTRAVFATTKLGEVRPNGHSSSDSLLHDT